MPDANAVTLIEQGYFQIGFTRWKNTLYDFNLVSRDQMFPKSVFRSISCRWKNIVPWQYNSQHKSLSHCGLLQVTAVYSSI